ncbi:MAG: sulfatase-like hydrolase/transferase, partial [Pseudomonadota bacterium]
QTPYNQTLFVMSSIFSLGPIDDFMTTPITDYSRVVIRRVLARSVRKGPVLKTLTQLGYHLQTVPSSYLPLQLSGSADTVANGSIVNPLELRGNFILSYDLLNRSPILSMLSEQWFGDKFGAPAVNFHLMQDLPNRRFAQRRDQPRFIYQHILAPHPPFNIAADGSPRETGGLGEMLDDGSQLIGDDETNRILYREGYLEKLKYVNRAIVSHIDYLQETRTGPLIIILHGDHGGGLHFDHEEKAKTCALERYSPLFAVYASDSSVLKEFSPDFNLVNTYRAIFRAILTSDLPDQTSLSKFVSWELDTAEVVHPEELIAACAQDHRTIIADRPTPSADKPVPDSVSH